jgi:hypothetical protein
MDAFTTGVREGTLHAPWKDEVWERENGHGSVSGVSDSDRQNTKGGVGSRKESGARAGCVSVWVMLIVLRVLMVLVDE